MKKGKNVLTMSLAFLVMVGFSCEKSDINDPNAAKGNLAIRITDAPIDSPEVSGAFVTITEIKVDGQTFGGFQGVKTVNLLELQQGNSLDLGTQDVAVGNYSKISLVLDSETDATGSGPGCFIQKTDGTKEKLEFQNGTSSEISLKPKSFQITENGQTELILDFDLRKALKKEQSNFSFVSQNELNSAIRVENKATTGEIKGNISNALTAGSNVVVYVYKKGSFNEATETKGTGTSNITYANAVSSTKVDASGNFVLAFIPEGDYEIYCAMPNQSGVSLNTLVELNSNTDLKNIDVNAGAQVDLSLSLDLDSIIIL